MGWFLHHFKFLLQKQQRFQEQIGGVGIMLGKEIYFLWYIVSGMAKF